MIVGICSHCSKQIIHVATGNGNFVKCDATKKGMGYWRYDAKIHRTHGCDMAAKAKDQKAIDEMRMLPKNKRKGMPYSRIGKLLQH